MNGWIKGIVVASVMSLFVFVAEAAIPEYHPLNVHVQNGSGISPETGDLTFQAWLTKDPSSVITETYGSTPGYIYFNVGSLGMWTDGDVVHIEVLQPSTGDAGIKNFTLSGSQQTFDDLAGIIIAPVPEPSLSILSLLLVITVIRKNKNIS